MALTEDIPYNVNEFATSEPEIKADDAEQPNKSVLVEVSEYLGEVMGAHNTMEILDITKDSPFSVEQQVAIHKHIINHLQTIKSMVDTKIKELK